MSGIIAFTKRQAPLQVQIVANRVANGFSYCVILLGAGGKLFDADHLADARGLAAFFSDHATETGPAEAFHRGSG
jgi:hypothetical protein